MAEYIDREATVKAFNNFDAGRAGGTHSTLLTPEEFAEYLYELPAVDVAPVVLCKDCEHKYESFGRLVCDHGVCKGLTVREDFFCADGVACDNRLR